MTTQRAPEVRSTANRTFSMIRIDLIDVVSPRGRGAKQFESNVRSIAENGLYKPILVNKRDFKTTGRYQLICGEGRLIAHRKLGRDLIKAEIVEVDIATAHIITLGENITKCPPRAIEYAYALQEMVRQGTPMADMERITGHPPQYIRSYVRLVEQGEDRLIKGVESGVFTIEFAMRVAESPEGAIQHLLMDAFDRKLITAKQVEVVRRLLAARTKNGVKPVAGAAPVEDSKPYTVEDLKKEIGQLTRDKERFSQEAESKQTRLIALVESLRRIRTDEQMMALLRQHRLDRVPDLRDSHGL
ncbi:MAG: ParB N-terminal domain-containing protein [Planctomycetes bacterium]|nr:ParB N-terminal domain-containing protein [Planctomycetota bacterium]